MATRYEINAHEPVSTIPHIISTKTTVNGQFFIVAMLVRS